MPFKFKRLEIPAIVLQSFKHLKNKEVFFIEHFRESISDMKWTAKRPRNSSTDVTKAATILKQKPLAIEKPGFVPKRNQTKTKLSYIRKK
jgi:hypothetical protein